MVTWLEGEAFELFRKSRAQPFLLPPRQYIALTDIIEGRQADEPDSDGAPNPRTSSPLH